VLSILLLFLHESTQALSNLIPHSSEHRELPIRRGSSRVSKALMKSLLTAGKYRARFLCVVADRKDILKLLARKFIHRLRAASWWKHQLRVRSADRRTSPLSSNEGHPAVMGDPNRYCLRDSVCNDLEDLYGILD
jgi:hypothetical protein